MLEVDFYLTESEGLRQSADLLGLEQCHDSQYVERRADVTHVLRTDDRLVAIPQFFAYYSIKLQVEGTT